MNTKKGIVIISSLLIIAALITGITVTTSPSLKYKGTCDTWYENNLGTGWITSYAKIVTSRWRIYTSLNEQTFFRLRFTELNILEEEPGTYDDFIVRMKADSVTLGEDGVVTITGISHWWKNGVRKDWDGPTTITIEETNYETQMIVDFGSCRLFGSLTP